MCLFYIISADIEKEMRRIYSIPDNKEVRLWNRYMSNTYEHLPNRDATLQDAGLYQGQVGFLKIYNIFIFRDWILQPKS